MITYGGYLDRLDSFASQLADGVQPPLNHAHAWNGIHVGG